MKPVQKRTYLVYSHGLMPDKLPLGSLFMDPANPDDDERKRFEHHMSAEQIKTLTWDPEVNEPYGLRFVAGREWLASAGVLNLLSGKIGRARSEEVVVWGRSCRRLQLKNPESYLNSVLLASSDATAWLSERLTVARAIYTWKLMHAGESRHPRIWLLTGVLLISNAVVLNTNCKSIEANVSASAPPPEPVAAAVSILTGQDGLLKLEGNMQVEQGTSTGYGHRDERVWAAQFAPLDVHFLLHGQGQGEVSLGHIGLRPLRDLGESGVRLGESAKVADIKLEEEATVVGLDKQDAKKWDEDPNSLLQEMRHVDWDLMETYLDLQETTVETRNSSGQSI